MWQDKLKKLKKQTKPVEKKKVSTVVPESRSQDIKFSDYCRENHIYPIKHDTIEPVTLNPQPQRRINPEPTYYEQMDFFDELNSDATFYRHGQKNIPKELRLGKFKIDATLDLHNYSKAHALDLLDRFIDTNNQNAKCIKIIHGQGTNSQNNHAVLLNIVRKYLQRLPQVIAYSYGSPKQGGNGITLVKLSR